MHTVTLFSGHYSPGDHLLLLVGGVANAAQVLAGRGQEVEAVVLEGLVY